MERASLFFDPTQLLVIVALFASLLYYISYKWRMRHLERLGRQLPGPKCLPLFGNTLEFMGDPEDYFSKLTSWGRKYKSPFRVWLGNYLFIAIYDPNDLQIVLKSPKTIAKDPLYRFFKNTVGTGLFSAPVDKWKKHRRLIAPAFNTKLMEQFLPMFNEKNKILVNKLGEEVGRGEFDVIKYIEAMNLDLICSTTMGCDVGAQINPRNDYATALKRASELDYMRIYKYWLHPEILFAIFGQKRECEKIYKQFHVFPKSVIQRKKKEYEENQKKRILANEEGEEKHRNTFLEILLDLSHSGANFTNQDLHDEVVTMMVGGSETTTLTNCFCLLMLAIHQKIQEKVYEEVITVLSDDEVSLETLSKLVYLEMVIKETLRRFPIGPLFLRQNTEELELTNCTLPPGCSIALSPYALHLSEDIYPNPEIFDPERFTSENISKRHPFSFIPFSGGPRGCIGSKYAMLSMKTTIAFIVREYHLETTCKMEDIKTRVDLLLRSINGYPIKITRRTK